MEAADSRSSTPAGLPPITERHDHSHPTPRRHRIRRGGDRPERVQHAAGVRPPDDDHGATDHYDDRGRLDPRPDQGVGLPRSAHLPHGRARLPARPRHPGGRRRRRRGGHDPLQLLRYVRRIGDHGRRVGDHDDERGSAVGGQAPPAPPPPRRRPAPRPRPARRRRPAPPPRRAAPPPRPRR